MQALNVKFSKMLRSDQFANQLSLLHEELPAENPKTRDYISKWLITLLTDDKTQTTSIDQFPAITKKIRDESLGKMDKNFFRRSSYYMSAKVMLQHSLSLQFGAPLGTFVYKIVMLNFLIELCAIYKEPDCAQFDIDLMSQMIAKMARRIDKLDHNKPPVALPKDVAQLYADVISDAQHTIETIRHLIDTHIEEIENDHKISAQLTPIAGLNLDADACYKMPKLIQYLRDRAKETAQIPSYSKRPTKSYPRHCKQGNRRPGEFEIADEVGKRIFWSDFENFVLYEMDNDDDKYMIYEDSGKEQMLVVYMNCLCRFCVIVENCREF